MAFETIGDDWDVEHVGHVTGREAALRFRDEDDAVRFGVSAGQEARQGDIAGAAQDDVVLVGSLQRGGCSGVDHEGVRLASKRSHQARWSLSKTIMLPLNAMSG